jgi:hypothetical protein
LAYGYFASYLSHFFVESSGDVEGRDELSARVSEARRTVESSMAESEWQGEDPVSLSFRLTASPESRSVSD